MKVLKIRKEVGRKFFSLAIEFGASSAILSLNDQYLFLQCNDAIILLTTLNVQVIDKFNK